jgi:hypothetical protein
MLAPAQTDVGPRADAGPASSALHWPAPPVFAPRASPRDAIDAARRDRLAAYYAAARRRRAGPGVRSMVGPLPAPPA